MSPLDIVRLKTWIFKVARRALGLDRTIYVNQRVSEYRGYWAEGASILGAQFRELSDGMWEVESTNRVTRIANYLVQADDPVILKLAGDKPFSYRLAESVGFRVPDYAVFHLSELPKALRWARRHQGPFVVKPAIGSSSGRGVTTVVSSAVEIAQAMALASLFAESIIVQQMIFGESCRLLILGGECIDAIRRRGVRVVADGRSTVANLLSTRDKNLQRDQVTRFTLSQQNLDLQGVPTTGEVLLRAFPPDKNETIELRTVYTERIRGNVDATLIAQAEDLASAIHSTFAGVDFIASDPSRGATAFFLEVNTTPGIHHHYSLAGEKLAEPIAATVLRRLLEHGSDRRL